MKTKTKPIGIRLPIEIINKIKYIAKNEKRTVNNFLNKIIIEQIEKDKNANKINCE